MRNIFKILIFLVIFVISKISADFCPKEFDIPDECFHVTEVIEFASTASSMQTLHNRYTSLLNEAHLIIDEDEPGTDFFFGNEMSSKERALQYYGNTMITYMEIVLHILNRDYGLKGDQIAYCFEKLNITGDKLDICRPYHPVDCHEQTHLYQPIDGVCSHPHDPYKGSKNTPYKRFLKNAYHDSIHEVRKSKRENSLPSARLLSNGLRKLFSPLSYENKENLNNDFLLFYMKVVILDIARTLKAQTWEGNYGFECCEYGGWTKVSERFFNYHCMPIDIPEKDPVFRGKKCMNYLRAMVTHDNCKLKEASILNTATHTLDLDMIYNHENVQAALEHEGLFPHNDFDIRNIILSGSDRAAMMPQIFTIIKIWIKYHNIVFAHLRELHPHISNDVLFYETRRFVIAVYQGVFYNEVLRFILSSDSLHEYKLIDSENCFDDNVEPIVTAEFVSSVARYFHIFIQNEYSIRFNNGTVASIPLRRMANNLDLIELSSVQGIVESLLTNPWNTESIASEPSNYLFTANDNPGLDLHAMDIQAERDFGIGTYCDALYELNSTEGGCVKHFKHLHNFIDKEHIAFLKYAYEQSCDVDLGVAGSFIASNNQNILSPVFETFFARQFHNLKCGDPYFYTNSLSEDQINFISHITFHDVLCLAANMSVQSFAFLTPGENNTEQHCAELDLESWTLLVEPNDVDIDLPEHVTRPDQEYEEHMKK